LSTKIGWVDYLLVGIGVLLLPVYLIGLLPIGIVIYRIGDKMQKYAEESDKEISLHITEIFVDVPIFKNLYKIDDYANDTLEEMK